MSAAMMSRPFNTAYVNATPTVSLDTTTAYVISDVIGLVEPFSTNLAYRLKSILILKVRWQSR